MFISAAVCIWQLRTDAGEVKVLLCSTYLNRIFSCSIIYLCSFSYRLAINTLKISLTLRSTHDFTILVITNDTANIIHESPFVKYFDNKNSIN